MRSPNPNTLLHNLSALLGVPRDDLQVALWKLYECHGARTTSTPGHNNNLPEPPPLDRLSILLWMCGFDGETRRLLRGKMPGAYSRRVEAEIKRISKLQEPMRTQRANDFIERYIDSNTLCAAIRMKYLRIVKEQEKIEERLAQLAEQGTKKAQKEAEEEAEAVRRYYWYRR